jgi:hypothetical protein
MQGKTVCIRPKVVGPFPGLYASGSYVHRAAPFTLVLCAWYDFEILDRYTKYVDILQHTIL